MPSQVSYIKGYALLSTNFMSETSVNNKRIAKNTLLLYFRMFFMMLISLYTSRVVLSTLGVEDFGIYNVVGGMVMMMGVFNTSMSVATQRFLTFELGRGDMVRLKQVFSMSMTIYIMYGLLFIIVAETMGLWLLNTQLTIPADKIAASNWLFQFSVISVVVTLLYNPYNAIIIAHEKMGIYAYISLLEALLKLGVVFLLLAFQEERLVYYGFFVMLSSLIVTLFYCIYCIRNYKESVYQFYWEKDLLRQILSYSGWNMFGALANMTRGQGLNILLNIFFNPSVNAARGISYQVNNIVTQFFNSFYTAVRPQITKYYAQNDIENMMNLVFRSSRLSFFLILFISLPLIVETPFIIQAWLGQTPEYVIPFTRLIVLITVVDGMSSPLMTTVQATGKIKLYQFVIGGATLMILPVSYGLLKIGYSAVSVFYASLFMSILCLFIRLFIVKKIIQFSVLSYIKIVFLRCFVCGLFSSIAPIMLSYYMKDGFMDFCVVVLLCLFSSSLFIWLLGLQKNEKVMLLQLAKKRLLRNL